MNILLIGKDVDAVATDIHNIYSNAHILKLEGALNNSEFLDFVRHNKSIVIADVDVLYDKYTINQIIDFCEKNNFTISFVSNDKKSKENIMFLALEERIPRMILWEVNPKNLEYDEFVIYSSVNLANDSSLRTSSTR